MDNLSKESEYKDFAIPLSIVTGQQIDMRKPSHLSPMCGWEKVVTNSPQKSPVTPTKRRIKPGVEKENLAIRRDLLPLCYSSDESPAKKEAGNQSEPDATYDNDLLYFKVPNIKFSDLHDWSKSKGCNVTTINPSKGLVVQKGTNSPTGSKVKVNEELIALFRYGDSVFAVNEKCPHMGGPLHLGDIEMLPNSICVTCPWHSWKIDLSNGKILSPLNRSEKAKVYPTQLDYDDSILIGFDTFSAKCFNLLQF